MNDFPQGSMANSLQLINKESFISQLEYMNEQPRLTERATSGISSDYNGSMGRDSGPVDRRSLLTVQVSDNCTTVEELFFNAQKDYVEQFVLGIDPRINE